MDCSTCGRAICFQCIRALQSLSQSEVAQVELICPKCHLLQEKTRDKPYQVSKAFHSRDSLILFIRRVYILELGKNDVLFSKKSSLLNLMDQVHTPVSPRWTQGR